MTKNLIYLYAAEYYVLYNFNPLDLSQNSEVLQQEKIEHGIVRKYLLFNHATSRNPPPSKRVGCYASLSSLFCSLWGNKKREPQYKGLGGQIFLPKF